MNNKKFRFFAVLLVTMMLLIGCTSVILTACGYGTSSPTTSAPASGNSVTLSNYSFSPSMLTVSVGTTVTWTNKDSVTHTVTSDSGVFDSGNLAPNATYSYTFNTAGTSAYHCSIHTTMKGAIIVQ